MSPTRSSPGPLAGTMSNGRAVEAPRPWSSPLVQVATISAVLLVAMTIGLAVDPRRIAGAPAWLKPAKFAASTVVYTLTIAWMVRDLPRTRTLNVATWLIAWISLVETLLVSLQAARGTTSHFNIDSPFDAAVYSLMGTGIFLVWVMSAVVLWQHFRATAADRPLALALRLGLALNILGAGTGWLMTQPRPEQLTAITRGERPRRAGTHTIGAPDGATGLPLLRWSGTHGDLRVPHFLGMHAFQLLPLLLLAFRRLRRRASPRDERRLVLVTAAACTLLFAGALVQAMAGRPFITYPAG